MKEPRLRYSSNAHWWSAEQLDAFQASYDKLLGVHGVPLSALYGQPPRTGPKEPFKLVFVTGPLNCQSTQVVWGASVRDPAIRVVPRACATRRARAHLALGPHVCFMGSKQPFDDAVATNSLLASNYDFIEKDRTAIYRNTWHLADLWREAREIGGLWIAEHDFPDKAASTLIAAIDRKIVSPADVTFVCVLAPDGWRYVERSQTAGITSLGVSHMAHLRGGPQAMRYKVSTLHKAYPRMAMHGIFADGDLREGARRLIEVCHGAKGDLVGRNAIFDALSAQNAQLVSPSLIPATHRRF